MFQIGYRVLGREFLESRNINHIKIATASPQANGRVEGINRDLGSMISKIVNIENDEQ